MSENEEGGPGPYAGLHVFCAKVNNYAPGNYFIVARDITEAAQLATLVMKRPPGHLTHYGPVAAIGDPLPETNTETLTKEASAP